MSGLLAHIFRHPIKAHGREALASVVLSKGSALPYDRHWAVTHELSKFDGENPGWMSCGNFQRGARTPAVMAITSYFNTETNEMILCHPERPELRFDPDTEGEALIAWLAPISPEERFRPQALVKVPGRAMTDSDYPTISVMNLNSNRALGAHLGAELDLNRWRGNLWLEGFAPWAERDWIGKRLSIGETVLEIREPIGRCKATTVDPVTGKVDLDTLRGLREMVEQQEFGVYGVVVQGGEIRPGDKVELMT